MRSGKTYTTINLAAARHMKNQIEALVIVCPTPIKDVWTREFKSWSPIDVDSFIITAGCKKRFAAWLEKPKPKMPLLIAGIEAMSQGNASDMLKDMLKKYKCMLVVDESSRIKNAQSTRTKKMIDFGGLAEYRLILTGTPTTQGIEDLYAQMQFLSHDILDCKSYFIFKNRYCIMGGFEGKKILGYQFEDELMAKIAPYVDQVTKEEAMPNLPPNDYEDIYVEPTKEQIKAMAELKEWMMAEQDDKELTIKTIMERMTRFQQILGGHFPYDDEETGGYDVEPIKGKNPKLEALISVLDGMDRNTKVIVWARFRPELAAISEALIKVFGAESVVEFHGGVEKDQRPKNSAAFQTDGNVRFMVANQTVGGMGQEWSAADAMVYYSNTFSYEDRKQSEERAIHTDKRRSIFYLNIVANHPADKMITAALSRKQDTAKWVEANLDKVKGEL
tara:strand:- start:4181 stop:5521 length:1341 start_codon:yes stop_codon:yes gene_type:complete